MTLLDDALEFRGLMDSLVTLGQRDLVRLWRNIEDWDAQTASAYFLDALPLVVEEYATLAGYEAADFYDAQLIGATFKAVPADPPSREQVQGSGRWSLRALYSDSASSPLDRIAGAFQRMVFQTSRDTVVLNAEFEPGTLWARYASGNACKFCQMLATRSDVYVSEAAASVVGAGRWDHARNWKGEKRGEWFGRAGRAQGSARSRGNQDVGKRYHDNCKCLAVPVRAGKTYSPPDYVTQWESDYKIASALAAENGDTSTTAILREWERLDRR